MSLFEWLIISSLKNILFLFFNILGKFLWKEPSIIYQLWCMISLLCLPMSSHEVVSRMCLTEFEIPDHVFLIVSIMCSRCWPPARKSPVLILKGCCSWCSSSSVMMMLLPVLSVLQIGILLLSEITGCFSGHHCSSWSLPFPPVDFIIVLQ